MADAPTSPDPRIPDTDPSPPPEKARAVTDARTVARPPRGAAPAGRRALVVLAFPIVILIIAGVLTLLDLNGSSIALISGTHASDPRIVTGTPRAVRSDEFLLASPVQVGNINKGFPSRTWVGLTDTDLNATSLGAPTASWLALVEPETWPLFALDAEHGFAARWWMLPALALLGVYALLLVLRPKPALAATLAVVIGLSPLVAWWSNSPGPIVGFLAASAAALLLAVRARRRWATVGLGLLAGYAASAAFFAFYPPWLVSVGLVMAAVVIGELVRRRSPWRRALLAGGSALAVLVPVVGLWWVQSADALAALTGTFYPGNRVSPSDGGIASVLFATPLNSVFSDHGDRIVADPLLNQSEVSSAWFPLPVLLLLVGFVAVTVVRARAVRRRAALDPAVYAAEPDQGEGRDEPGGARDWATFIAVTAVAALLLLWMFVPLPPLVGRVTLLNRVPGYRATLALGVCTVLLVYLVAGRLPAARWAPRTVLSLAATAATGALAWWSATQLLRGSVPGTKTALLVGLIVAAAFCLLALAPIRWPAMVVLIAVVGVNYAMVNPLYQGLGPLTHGPLASTLETLAQREGPSKWVDLAGGFSSTVITASPQELLSGMTYYPSKDVWERLAPTQEARWNNYSKYFWEQNPTADPAVIEQIHGTNQRLVIDLCSPDVAFLGIRYVLTSTTAPPRCFSPVATVRDLGGTFVISRRR
jgi:hypothetical protein